jgi:hypothetical protein
VPSTYSSSSRQTGKWQHLIRERERYRGYLEEPCWAEEAQAQHRARIEELSCQIEQLDTDDLAKAKAERDRFLLRQRAVELARGRVFDFIGAPDAQMRMAGRLWGHCSICAKELTDPVSLERGIGPECLGKRVDAVKQLTSAGHKPETIAVVIGMPVAFVTEVLGDAARQLNLFAAG